MKPNHSQAATPVGKRRPSPSLKTPAANAPCSLSPNVAHPPPPTISTATSSSASGCSTCRRGRHAACRVRSAGGDVIAIAAAALQHDCAAPGRDARWGGQALQYGLLADGQLIERATDGVRARDLANAGVVVQGRSKAVKETAKLLAEPALDKG